MRMVSLIGLLLLLWATLALADGFPQYVFMNLNPVHGWDQSNSDSMTPEWPREIAATLDLPPNPDLKLGISYIFSLMETPADQLAVTLHKLLSVCEEAEMPLLITLDGQNWWTRRPDLWNWWDPEAPGYNPDNGNNVEWTSWDPKDAVKISWRNWGSQIRVVPCQNLFARPVMSELLGRYKTLIPIIADWYKRLPTDKKWLLRGVKLGWETGIGYNAFYYPDGNSYLERWPKDPSHDPTYGLKLEEGLSGGCVQLGYASLKAAGIKSSGEITRDDLARLTHEYLAVLCRKANFLGLPKELIITHMGGNYAPWDVHIPAWPAMNEWSTPGYSFYWQDPRELGDFPKELTTAGRKEWAASEWLWPGQTAEEWRDHFERTLSFEDCQFLVIYNWSQGVFGQGLPASEGLKQFFATWRRPVSH